MNDNCPIECVNIGCPQPSFLQQHETFLLTLIASLSGCIGIMFSYFLKSRCKKIEFCCLKCDRDVLQITQNDIEIQN